MYLEKILHLLLMAQFHNAPSNFEDLASGEIGISYRNPQLDSE